MKMTTILNTDNLFEYLASLGYCDRADRETSLVTVLPAKDFNLLIQSADGKHLSVNQEIHDDRDRTSGGFDAACQIGNTI